MNDDEILNRRPCGPEWFSAFVRAHYGPALRYAARLLGDATEAEDAVQEAFAEASAHLDSLQDPKAAPAWLRSIVRHRCLRRFRRRDVELVSFAFDEGACADAGLARDSADERAQRVAQASLLLESLPDHEREIVTLFYVKECTHKEIASFLGLPPSTVNNRLHEARERMRRWEEDMESNLREPVEPSEERVSRVGTVIAVRGALVEVRFEPGASFDIFDALVVVDAQGKSVECLKVAHRSGDGRVSCLVTNVDISLQPGTTLLNTGKVGIDLSLMRRVRSVSDEHLLSALSALQGPASRTPVLLPTGIKAIDLLCPLPREGVVVQAATGGVGRVVLLDELSQRLTQPGLALRLLGLVDRTEPDPLRGWAESVPLRTNGGIGVYWALSHRATDPELELLDAADAAIYLSPLLAIRGWYPAIDAEHSRSLLLRPEIVGAEHCELAGRAREALVFLKRAYADPVMLELLAARAFAAARRRLPTFSPRVQGSDVLRLARARKLQLFLTQPFGVATEHTGWPSLNVPIEATLGGCRAILDGEVDAVPEEAFAYAGTLDDVQRHARENVQRRYG